MNFFRTSLLLAAMTALFMGLGYMLAGEGGMIIALVVAAGMNVFSYWNSDKMVLRMHNAVEVDERQAPELYEITRRLAEAADLPMPKVYVINTDQPNAFATGRNPENAAVAATTGLLNQLSYEEVAAVMAHELAHVKNRDTLIMTITATIAGAISMLTNIGLFFGGSRNNNNPFGMIGVIAAMILAPLAAMLVQMAISRTREYAADRLGAEICGNPLWLASALKKIAGGTRHVPNERAEQNPATAHMFIINPLSGRAMDSLFATHPNTDNRIEALLAMEEEFSHGRSQRGSQRYPQSAPPRAPSSNKTGPWGGGNGPTSVPRAGRGRTDQKPGQKPGPWG